MKIKIVGLQKDVHITYEGNEFVGRRIFYHFVPDQPTEGVGCGAQFLNDQKFSGVDLVVGETYLCDRNYGKLANFMNIKDLLKEVKNG